MNEEPQPQPQPPRRVYTVEELRAVAARINMIESDPGLTKLFLRDFPKEQREAEAQDSTEYPAA